MFVPRDYQTARYAANSEPGVVHLWRHEDQTLLPDRRELAVRTLAIKLGVPPDEVFADVAKTVEGHTRIVASWMPS